MARSPAILSPNFGLYLDRPLISVPARAIASGSNVRIFQGKLTNQGLGWSAFHSLRLNGAVLMVANFFLRDGTDRLVFATPTDLYRFKSDTNTVVFITPSYVTGTAAASGTGVTGTGTTWSTNVSAGDQISFGSASQNSPSATWFTIQNVGGNTSITLTATAGVVVDGPYTIRKLFTGDIFDHWDSTVFTYASPGNADLMFITNGVQSIVKWDGSSTFASFASFGFTLIAKHLTVSSNALVAGNITVAGVEQPTSIINSDVGSPENMSSGLASQNIVHPGPDPIVDLLPLGDNLAIYGLRSVTLAQFVGDPLIWVFRQAVTTYGTIGNRTVADFGNYHEFVAADGLFRFDGASSEQMATQVFPAIIRMKDPRRDPLAYHFVDDERGELNWVIPLVADPGADADDEVSPATAWSEHFQEDVGPNVPVPFGVRDFPFTSAGRYTQQTELSWATVTGTWADTPLRWDDQSGLSNFPITVVGDADGYLFQYGSAETANGAAMPSFARFGRRATVDGRARGLIARIYPFTRATLGGGGTLNVVLGLSDHASGGATDSDAFPFDLDLPEGGHFVTPYRRGRFYEVQFGTDGPSEPYDIEGWEPEVRIGGYR